jgi:2-polyprenyl-3-methyl-5-hydroxy-6-metoxy-1,4-benzoquinol methylase
MHATAENIVIPLELPINRIQAVDSREDFIVDACKGKKVLHVGCTDWPLTEQRLRNNDLLHVPITAAAAQCTGLDLSAEGIAVLEAAGIHNVELGNAEHMATAHYRAAGIEMIVAGEVVEHLNNPGLFLEGCAEILRDGGALLITVPNAFAPSRFARLLFGTEQVHKDHVAYYSPKTMNELLRRHGFQVTFLGVSYPYPAQPFLKPWKLVGHMLHRLRPFFGWSCIFIATFGKSPIASKKVLG